MRLALISDIHGNPIALDAVIADVESQGGVDGYWVLGDLVAIGYDPLGVLTRLAALPNARFVRGNTDRVVANGQAPAPPPQSALLDPRLVAQGMEISRIFGWAQGFVAATGWLKWMRDLPLEQRLTLPDGTRMLAVHAAPGTDEGPGIRSSMSDDEVCAALSQCEADLVCVAHTHRPLDRVVGGVHVVNLGSVSNPLTSDLRASYALLEADATGYEVQIRRVDYDREAAIAATIEAGHPPGSYLVELLSGRYQASLSKTK